MGAQSCILTVCEGSNDDTAERVQEATHQRRRPDAPAESPSRRRGVSCKGWTHAACRLRNQSRYPRCLEAESCAEKREVLRCRSCDKRRRKRETPISANAAKTEGIRSMSGNRRDGEQTGQSCFNRTDGARPACELSSCGVKRSGHVETLCPSRARRRPARHPTGARLHQGVRVHAPIRVEAAGGAGAGEPGRAGPAHRRRAGNAGGSTSGERVAAAVADGAGVVAAVGDGRAAGLASAAEAGRAGACDVALTRWL